MIANQPPAHLSPSSKEWWLTTVETYVLQEHHLRLLQLVCEAWDRAQAARERVDREGLTVPGREGGLRPHPCIAIERDARLAVARLVRELDLERDGFSLNREGDSRIRNFLIQPAGWGGGRHEWEDHIHKIFGSGLLRRLSRAACHGARRLRSLPSGSAP
jgi:P27 family predicted phage terminase small subunit